MERRLATLRWLGWELYELAPELVDELTDADNMAYAKALTVCAAGDGEISQRERDWIVGFLTTAGVSDDIVEAIRSYDGGDGIEDLLNSSPIMTLTGRATLYDALRACASDGELSDGERARVQSAAEVLGIPAGIVTELEQIVREEDGLRKRRHQLIVADVLAAANA